MLIEYKFKNDYTPNFIDVALIYEDDNNIYLSGENLVIQLCKVDLDYLLIKGG